MSLSLYNEEDFVDFIHLDYALPFQGYRKYVAFAYMGVNAAGFMANIWVLYMVAPLLFCTNVKVPKSILFYIITLCISDLMIMIGMLFLIIEIVMGTWKFGSASCIAYLVFEGMNKFVAPVIVVLVSRTCYVTVCLKGRDQHSAASLKRAVLQVLASMIVLMVLLWPVFTYSQVYSLFFNANETQKTVFIMRKCSFLPPPGIELGFGIISCISSYAIPLGGMIYWYVSVSFFLRKQAEKSLVYSRYIGCSKWVKIMRKTLAKTFQRYSSGSVTWITFYLINLSTYTANIYYHLACVYQHVYNILFYFNSTDNSNDLAMRRVIATVLVLTVVYVSCWTPYWLSIFAHKFIKTMSRRVVIASYLIHLLPYISCSAYPVIFTLMNRRIKLARAELMQQNRRKFRSYSNIVSSDIRLFIQKYSPLRNIGNRIFGFVGSSSHCVQNENSLETITEKASRTSILACQSVTLVDIINEAASGEGTLFSQIDFVSHQEGDDFL